ncbi:hypothetical protein Aspvir_003345 [Aspergillus viridinutans]|uniref:Uncharacterized protein n=1 Tax=Aspergillus viridinutans TaxID=75553 RepID=A0A9P3F760_ASPVI|nr:uncharacterized protein Aspvir_003345 [Aspergillus viridinutans]GIK07679.1 hypothetical protein Aspvir_003345 [Aspergillus viridinutans]
MDSIKVPEIAVEYDLHGVGRKIISEITSRVETCLPSNQPRKRHRRPKNKPPSTSNSRITRTGGGALLQPNDALTSRRGHAEDLQTESQHGHTRASGTEQSSQDHGRFHPIPGIISDKPHIHHSVETGFSQQHPRTTEVEREGLIREPTTIERPFLSEAVPTRITAILNNDPNPGIRAPPAFFGPAEIWDSPGTSERPTKRRRTMPNYSTHHGTSGSAHIRGQLNGKKINEIFYLGWL